MALMRTPGRVLPENCPALTDVIEAYERRRWSLGRIPEGKGTAATN